MSAAGKLILFLHGADGPVAADAAFLAELGKTHRVLVPALEGVAMAEQIARAGGGGAHVVADGAAAAIGCRLALDHPDLVASLVLSAPEPADALLLARLGDIKAPCLLLQASKASASHQAAMEAYQQRITRATRILFYGTAPGLPLEPGWTRLVADFIDRGERFVVNAGGDS